MKDYIIEISTTDEEKLEKTIAQLIKKGLKRDESFPPKKFKSVIKPPSEQKQLRVKNRFNHLIKGKVSKRNLAQIERMPSVTNLWLATVKFDKKDFLSFKISYCKVVEINESSITAKVLINKEERRFQRRSFDIEPLSEMDLKLNDFIEITMITHPGQQIFNYRKILDAAAIMPLFKKKSHFKELENSNLFKHLPATK